MKKCIVIGGGFAGLSASAYLSDAGYKVELIEASPKLGGRAYSFLYKETNTLIDNGQHIMMGCYHDTMSFLSLIGALDKVQVQEKMRVNFLKPGFELHELKTSSLPYPINFFNAILNFTAVTFRDRLSILRLFIKLPFLSERDLAKLSVDEFLIRENQNENVKKAFWEILCVGALNTSLQKASAKMLVDVLKIIFLHGSKGSRLVIPKEGLSEMYCDSTKQFIERKGGSIALSEKVEEIVIEKGKAAAIRTNKRTIDDFDFVICAVPFYALERMFSPSRLKTIETVSKKNINLVLVGINPDESVKANSLMNHFNGFPDEHDLRYSSILNVHVWLKQNDLENNFYGLIDSKVHWVFSHTSHINCVISDADYLMPLSDDEIMSMIFSELQRFMNINKQDVNTYFIVKEKRATFVPSKEILNNRSGTETEIKNLFLAGDWVNTGLPSTIESAVKSGRMAADVISI
jgi:squalene-associated FAD-dependent desaturase